MSTPAANQPSPMLFFETVTAFQRSAAMKAAVDLDVFTAIGEGATTAAEVAARAGASERGTRVLCDYLTILGFLTKEDGRYALTPDSAVFLDRRSPAYAGGVVEFLHAPEVMGAFSDLTTVVRTGTTATGDEGTMEPDHPVWVAFAKGMMAMMHPAAQAMAEMAALDPTKTVRVLDVAREHVRAFGVEDRWTARPGSAFEVDFGEGYDVVLLTNFLHHFDAETNTALLRKVRAALADGGRAVTLEFVPNDDRVTPPTQAAFALTMLASTKAGDAFTFRELEKMFADAGFSRSEATVIPPGAQTVVISEK